MKVDCAPHPPTPDLVRAKGVQPGIRIIGSGAALPATMLTREALDARLGLMPGTLSYCGAARQRYFIPGKGVEQRHKILAL